MELNYASPFEAKPRIIAWLLNQSYAQLVRAKLAGTVKLTVTKVRKNMGWYGHSH
jgi:hypothetical protein